MRVAFKSPRGITVRQAAQSLFSTDDPSRNEIEKARRKLDLRGLNLILYLAIEALIERGPSWADYFLAFVAIEDLGDRIKCEIADQELGEEERR